MKFQHSSWSKEQRFNSPISSSPRYQMNGAEQTSSLFTRERGENSTIKCRPVSIISIACRILEHVQYSYKPLRLEQRPLWWATWLMGPQIMWITTCHNTGPERQEYGQEVPDRHHTLEIPLMKSLTNVFYWSRELSGVGHQPRLDQGLLKS